MTGDTTDDSKRGSPLSTLASGAGLVFGGRITKLAFGFAIQVVLARLLGSDAYGGFILASMTMAVGILFARLGMKSGLLRKLPYHEDNPQEARGVVKASVQLGIVSGVLVSSIIFLAAPIIATRVFGDPSIIPLIRLVAVGIPFSVLLTIGVSIARALRDAKPHVIVNQILNTALTAVLVSALLFAGYGAVGAILAKVIAIAISATIALYLAYRALPFPLRGPTVRMHRDLLTFSLPLVLAASANWALAQTDTVLVGVFMTSAGVGVYNVAYRLHSLGMVFFYPVTFLLPPVLTRLMERDDETAAKRTYQVATKWMTLLTFPLFLLVFLFPEVVIETAFGSAYRSGADVLRILIIPVIVTTFMGANGSALIAFGHNRINLYGNGAISLLNVGLNIVLIPEYGLIGAATATATAFIIRDGFYATLLYHWYNIQPFSPALVRPLAGIVMLVPVGYFGFKELFEPRFLTVTAIGLLFLIVYGPLVIRLGAVESADIDVFNRFEKSAGVEFDEVKRVVSYLSP